MVTIRHVDGPGRFTHAALEAVSMRRDTHEVSEPAAAYLCDELGFFERVEATDAEFRELGDDVCDVVQDDGQVCGRELPCQYHSDEAEE